MWKKNKLPIFLLAIVAMLSIFYIYSDKNPTDQVGGDDLTGETENAVFAEARLKLLETRDKSIKELEATIAAGKLTEAQITEKVGQIDKLYNLKYSEIELENEIMAMGFNDAFVCVDGTNIKIDVLAEEFTTAQFVTVALAAKGKFAKNYAVQIAVTNPQD